MKHFPKPQNICGENADASSQLACSSVYKKQNDTAVFCTVNERTDA